MHERIPITHPESVTPILNESSQAEPRQKKEYVLFEEVRPEVLVAQYLGELFIYKAMQNANVFTLQRIAESYCDLPDYLQHQFDQTAGNKNKNITQIIALSYARNGDFTRADEELHPQDGSHPPITFADSYAVTLAQHEEDPSEAYEIAL